jgi:hypothetical protein
MAGVRRRGRGTHDSLMNERIRPVCRLSDDQILHGLMRRVLPAVIRLAVFTVIEVSTRGLRGRRSGSGVCAWGTGRISRLLPLMIGLAVVAPVIIFSRGRWPGIRPRCGCGIHLLHGCCGSVLIRRILPFMVRPAVLTPIGIGAGGGGYGSIPRRRCNCLSLCRGCLLRGGRRLPSMVGFTVFTPVIIGTRRGRPALGAELGLLLLRHQALDRFAECRFI